MTALARRTVLTAAWTTPALVVATTAPAVATSQARPRIRFTNVTVTDGKKDRTLYVNTRIQVTDGPEPVRNLQLTITVTGLKPRAWSWEQVDGWGTTGQVYAEWKLPAASAPITVTFTASADGVQTITDSLTVTAPTWWKDQP